MWLLAEIQSAVPPGVLYTAALGLCGIVGHLFWRIMEHHARAVAEWQAERAEWRKEREELMKANRELSDAVNDLTKTVAQLITTMFFLPTDFKKTSIEIIKGIEERQNKP